MANHKNNKFDNLSALKVLVFVMGITLIIGVIFLGVVIYKRGAEFGKCKQGEVQIGNTTVQNMAVSGNKIAILVNSKQQKNKKEIIIFDYCKDKEISRVIVR